MEPQCFPFLLTGAGPGKSLKSLNFRNDSSEPCLAPPMNQFRALYYKHQKLALANLNQNGIYWKGANNIERIAEPGLLKQEGCPQSISQNWPDEDAILNQTLYIIIDLGIADHMGDFDKSGFTFNGNKRSIWMRSGKNERKGSRSCSDERNPYIRGSREIRLWLWQGWCGGKWVKKVS